MIDHKTAFSVEFVRAVIGDETLVVRFNLLVRSHHLIPGSNRRTVRSHDLGRVAA